LQIGRIYYNESNADGCSRSNFTQDFSGDPDGILTPIFLVDRGTCTFVQKVRNIEKAGGSLAVIIDDSDAIDIKQIVMSDDGTGTGIRIPSMLISKRDGKILKDFLRSQSPEVAAQAALSAEFIFENLENRVDWSIWYTSANDKALDFIKNFKETYKTIAEEANFRPRFVTWACPSCDADFKRKECFSNGKYCAMNHKSTYVEGKDILMEDLRESCLYDILKKEGQASQWWEYMAYVHKMCYEEVTEDCSKMGHKAINRDYQPTLDCVKSTFSGSNYAQDDNKVFKEDSEAWKTYGTGYWPSIVINDRSYRGDLIPDNVFNALCSSFSSEPDACKAAKYEA
jgi:hypothetical protein